MTVIIDGVALGWFWKCILLMLIVAPMVANLFAARQLEQIETEVMFIRENMKRHKLAENDW